jgi:hypothetical protein
MVGESSRMGKDLKRILKRLRVGKKSLHDTEIKAENLDASIQTAIHDQETRKQNRKHSR